MKSLKKFPFDLALIHEVFDIDRKTECDYLSTWLSAQYILADWEQNLVNKLHKDMQTIGEYWNEEELKIRFVGSIFNIADIDVSDKLRVFYERSLKATIHNYQLNVVCDCLVAASTPFSTPKHPYFFLQEFKKEKGEKNDPEAQMLVAMLIAQHLNNDNKPIYGGYLVGANWRFTTLIGNAYCVSRRFDASRIDDLTQTIFILRHLKSLVLG